MSVPTILAFDTSAAHCAAALLRAGTIVASAREEMAKGQAERLMPLLEEILAAGGVAWRDLDALAVGIGPGNFTGIRISVACARGLALGLGKPAIGVSTLEAQAFGRIGDTLSLVDARRDQAYAQRFHDGSAQSAPVVGDRASFANGIESCIAPLADTLARIAATRLGTAQPRPAPLYIRAADAAPPRDPAPVILEE
ncbi:tRNA threonylcarbamoyladenosine biosynthesis protein TsaB [Aquimixticola soesokkakensis]|uniref:tRNA threonylcarbamoyladenosine biosynthesis protein TsaB n=1 Tax=Aquimixticola soesokkakensis TaxID=1519096 RepID=A0A1Y5T0E4_9RHOB|nr:tRNA (adenosine(37)-N6)-threonylcarbamoyltransferase complex dimerization subunit type 1 TsaB [Aquimixticola soesokkakensis]SLN53071.1 tRNA threonylcarbamoyladenosine biosynthesis protein TsaB [Aquimixticola soesokkakensis]